MKRPPFACGKPRSWRISICQYTGKSTLLQMRGHFILSEVTSVRRENINRLMVRYGTVSGLVALSIQDAVHYLPEAYCKGIASSMLLLTGIYAAEQNREDLSTERRHFLLYALSGGAIFAAALSLAAPLLMHLFTSDMNLQALGTTAFRWYLLGVPFVGVNLGMISYCQGMGKHILAWRLTILHTLSHIGLRLVFASADDVRYSHFLNLNNVCIRVAVEPSAEKPVLTEAAEQ